MAEEWSRDPPIVNAMRKEKEGLKLVSRLETLNQVFQTYPLPTSVSTPCMLSASEIVLSCPTSRGRWFVVRG